VESWSATGEVADALAEFDGWHETVRAILGAAERTHRWGLYDREPLPTWSVGRVTLLGDAAHAMLPFMAQGACQSIEDAVVLARGLAAATPATIPAALTEYETLRKPRVWQVQRASWRNATVYHLRDGENQRERDAAWAASAARGPYSERGWLFAYDAGDPDMAPRPPDARGAAAEPQHPSTPRRM
jgi:salicylate hydroxylase